MDLMKLVRYADGECQAWFTANNMVPLSPQEHHNEETQALNLSNICMVDGTWTSTAQWMWMSLDFGRTAWGKFN